MATEIVWVEDPLTYLYLREDTYLTTAPRNFPVRTWLRRSGYRVIGYEVMEHEKGTGRTAYRRRFWYLKSHDRDLDPEGVYKYLTPTEAVIPSSKGLDRESIRYQNTELFRDDMKRLRAYRESLPPR